MIRRWNKWVIRARICCMEAADILKDEAGIGTVEMILILVVLIALVLIFKSKLTSLVNEIFDKITSQSRLV